MGTNTERPNIRGTKFSTRESLCFAQLLGYHTCKGVGFTESEINALAKAYGFDLGSEDNDLFRVGTIRNLLRRVETDGYRVMALLGRFLENQEDPVKLVASGLAELGFDICLDDDEMADEPIRLGLGL